MDLPTALLLILGGGAAGFVNAVAGGGSVITLPILVEVLGDASTANGTNRIAILMSQVVAAGAFSRAGKMPWSRVMPLVAPIIGGSIAGAWVATLLSPGAMKRVFAFVILLVAVSVLVKPSRWMGGTEKQVPEPWRSLSFFGIGLYGGFVQAGVGFLLLAGLVIAGGLDLVRGNAAKVFLIMVYTPVSLIIFILAGQVDLLYGAVMGIGNVTGALIATRLAVTRGAGWIRWVLVLAAVAAAVRMLFF